MVTENIEKITRSIRLCLSISPPIIKKANSEKFKKYLKCILFLSESYDFSSNFGTGLKNIIKI